MAKAKEKPKMLLLLFFGLLLAIAQLKFGSTGTYVWIPFADVDLNFGILYVPFIIFVVAAMTNAVNFTDGLDGLLHEVHARLPEGQGALREMRRR